MHSIRNKSLNSHWNQNKYPPTATQYVANYDSKYAKMEEKKEEKSLNKTCEPIDIHNVLLFSLNKLFIDIRPNSEYSKNHIFQFSNITINTEEQIVISILKHKLNDICENSHIDIYFCSNKEIKQNK